MTTLPREYILGISRRLSLRKYHNAIFEKIPWQKLNPAYFEPFTHTPVFL